MTRSTHLVLIGLVGVLVSPLGCSSEDDALFNAAGSGGQQAGGNEQGGAGGQEDASVDISPGTGGDSGKGGSSQGGQAGVAGSGGLSGNSGSAGSGGSSGAGGLGGNSGTGGTAGLSGSAGSGGSSGNSGTGGTAGLSGSGGSGGSSGNSGAGGTAGLAGKAGTAGSGGSSGTAGAGGTAGQGGSSGTAGVSGNSGTGGTAGLGGSAGSAGTAGIAGQAGTAGQGGAAGSAGSGGSTTGPEIVSLGATNKYLLKGLLVTPFTATPGEVLVESNILTCVAPSCSNLPSASGATVIDTHGMLFPGMIDAHNHILYDVFDESDWTPSQLYQSHTQWTQEPEYGAMQDCYDYLLDSVSSGGVNLDCEVLKYGELKGMIVGTTSILGEPKGSAMKCYASLARSIDGSQNDLPPIARPSPCTDPASNDHIQVAALGIDTVDETAAKQNFATCKTWSYVVHVGEGIQGNNTAYSEWTKTVAKGLDVEQFSIIHGTALGTPEFQHMANSKMKLIWSPKSNMFLYGATTRIDLAWAVSPKLTIALAPDWSLGGSVNILDELNYAWQLSQQQWPGLLSSKDLVLMVTSEAAKALEIQAQVGTLEQGKLADLFVLSGDSTVPYDTLVQARPSQIRLVMVNGAVLYGDAYLSAAASLPSCETIDVCGSSRFLCVKEQSTADKLDQSYSDIVTALSQALTNYDTAHSTHFAPLAPLVKCP